MRRRLDIEMRDGAPLRLVRYDPVDWTRQDEHPAVLFYRARDAWLEAGRELPPMDSTTTWPDVPFDPADL